MTIIKYFLKIVAFLAGLLVLLNFTKSKEKDQYILLNAQNEE